MACPHISGIIACMLEANPNLTPHEVKAILKDTAETRGEPYDPELDKEYSREYGWGLVDAYKAVLGARGEAPIEDEVTIEIRTPSEGRTVSDSVDITGIVEVEGEPVIDSIEITVGGKSYRADGAESWSYSWNTWDVENGNYTLTATVTANDGNLTDFESIGISVNNTGSKPKEDSDELIDIEELKELNEVTGSIIAVLAVIIVLTVVLIIRKRRSTDAADGPEADDEGFHEYDEEW
jgi:subtilisin family serine protease